MKTKFLILIILPLLTTYTWAQKAYTLEAYKALALQNNYSIFEKNKMKEVAEMDSKLAKANRYPTIDVSGTASNLFNAPNDLFPSYFGMVSADLNLPIYVGGKINKGIELAQMGKEVREEQVKLAKQEVILRTEELYWNALKLKEQINLSVSQFNSLQKLENELAATVEVGLAQKNDLLKVQVGKNGALLKKEILENQFEVTKKALQQHVGIPITADFRLADSTIEMSAISGVEHTQLVEEAMGQRSELSLLEKQVEVEVTQQAITDADYLPQVAFTLSAIGLFTKETTLSDPFPATTLLDGTSYIAIPSLGVKVPLFHAGARQTKKKKHQLQTQIYQENLKDAQEKISVEIYQAWVAWKTAYNTVEVNRLSVTQAAENLRLYRDQFEAGLVNGSDVLDAQFLWEEAQFNVISGKADFKIKEAQLQKALGRN